MSSLSYLLNVRDDRDKAEAAIEEIQDIALRGIGMRMPPEVRQMFFAIAALTRKVLSPGEPET